MTNFFAKNIKYFREQARIEQQRMAEDLGVPQSTLSCWEKGIRTPNLDMIARIAKYLKIYDDFITKDLTIPNDNIINNTQLLFDKANGILPDNDRATIEFIMRNAIENQEKSKEENKEV